eukprot:snap_masked-scaffold_10-processed-gene-7.26-mRNA-1 protein AED:1.00 eAED:1.00 QI:0/0/0/0/1/1/2/0/73
MLNQDENLETYSWNSQPNIERYQETRNHVLMGVLRKLLVSEKDWYRRWGARKKKKTDYMIAGFLSSSCNRFQR